MLKIEFKKSTVKKLEKKLRIAKKIGNVGQIQKICAILMLAKGLPIEMITGIWCICDRAMYNWISDYLCNGLNCFRIVKRSGRKASLTPEQKEKLKEIIDEGPEKYGFDIGCWNSVMIQRVIRKEFKVSYHRHYVCELLRKLGYSYQKGKFTPIQADELQRQEWLMKTWPELLTKAKNAHLLFIDEVSFPLWGSLGRTWARVGQQPLVKTTGRRKNLKVFGAIEHFTGKFVYKTEEGRLSATSYLAFLKTLLNRFDKQILIIHDGATYHRGALIKKFLASQPRIQCYQLPKYSPDYNIIEDLWKKAKSRVHNKFFCNFQSLKKSVHAAFRYLQRNISEILALQGVYAELTFPKLPEVA
jgi:transposase